MEFWQRVHWFSTPKCNEKCKFCFRPEFWFEDSPKVMEKLATVLADNEVKEVIFTGGEPLLSKGLDASLEILYKNGIDTSIHTNGVLLNPGKINRLVNLVDEIAIPLDSVNRATQKYLREKDCLPQIKEVLKQLQDKDVRIGIHTVATAINIRSIPKIYDFLDKGRFDYWRIYEFNEDLVLGRTKTVDRFREVMKLRGKPATETDGGVNCLYADFLLMEEKMSRHKDKKVQFVGVYDYDRNPYFFIDSSGNAYMVTWFSQKRKPIGNLLKDGFVKVRDRAVEEYSKGPEFDEDAFVNAENDKPLWARAAWEGSFFMEEIEDLELKYCDKFRHLANLYLNRLKKQGEAPKDAKLLVG